MEISRREGCPSPARAKKNRRRGFGAESQRGDFGYNAVADGDGDKCRLDANGNCSVNYIPGPAAQVVSECIFKRNRPVLRQ